MTTLCGCVAHEDHVARSAAVRTLGTIVVFPFLSQVFKDDSILFFHFNQKNLFHTIFRIFKLFMT